MLRGLGYPIVSTGTITAWMRKYLATPEGAEIAQQFVAAGIQSYFMANPIEGDIAEAVAAYIAAHPPANGQNATAAQVQEAVDAYFTVYPVDTVTNAELAAAVAAYLIANPPQPGAPGPAGQNATEAQVAAAVASYMAANPLTGAVTGAVAAYMAANPSQKIITGTATPLNTQGNVGDYFHDSVSEIFYGPKAASGTIWPVAAYWPAKDVKTRLSTNSSGVWTKTYPANFWKAEPSVNVNPIAAANAGQIGWKTTKTLASNAWTVRVDFSLTATVLGLLSIGVSPGVTTFDYQAFEATP